MTQRSSSDPQKDILGDPIDPNAEGNPANWVIGGPGNEADAVCIVAGDDAEDVAREIDRLLNSLDGASLLIQQDAENLLGDLHGHEHFGFLDGVSQPGIRGIVSNDPGDVLTPRQNPLDPEQGKPGQDLLWPGSFVFGYVGQDGTTADITGHTPNPIMDGPDWAKDGSYLVFRRLRQDVAGFHRFLNEQANILGISPDELGAKLVGRWHSGAPIMRAPDMDDKTLGDDDCANNNFEFGDAKPPILPTTPDACADNTYPSSQADTTGAVCPFAGHIRKSYPRDDDPPGEVRTQTHRLLRRGIPFGTQSDSTPDNPQDDYVDRGLCFFCYNTSIVNQFEFVTRRWVNNADFKAPGSGQDPIIGQNNNPADNRKRTFKITYKDDSGTEKTVNLETDTDWVIPTGGGYFFTPSIEAIENHLS
jgi:Dyp-type peroxidase family